MCLTIIFPQERLKKQIKIEADKLASEQLTAKRTAERSAADAIAAEKAQIAQGSF